MISFLSNVIKVLFTRDGDLLLTGERMGNTLYQLNLKPEIQKTQIKHAQISFDVAFNTDIRYSITIWHQRLGYIGYHTQKKMIQQDLVIGLNVCGNLDNPTALCSGCELGKFTRSPLKIGRNRANRIGAHLLGHLRSNHNTQPWGSALLCNIKRRL
jgi:hypothetical protein